MNIFVPNTTKGSRYMTIWGNKGHWVVIKPGNWVGIIGTLDHVGKIWVTYAKGSDERVEFSKRVDAVRWIIDKFEEGSRSGTEVREGP